MKTSQHFLLPAFFAATLLFASPAQVHASKELQPVHTQQDSPFSSFRTHRQGKGIMATWSVATTDGIVGFTVQRTYEDAADPYAYWENLSTVPFNTSRSFTYKDMEVFPGIITYRIVAIMSDGTTAGSTLSTVRIVSHK